MPTTTRLTATPHTPEFTATDGAMLYLALELSQRGWTLAFTTGRGQVARIRKISAGALEALEAEIARARRRFGLPPTAPVVSCYEAGRDAFWVHRALLARGIGNVVVMRRSYQHNDAVGMLSAVERLESRPKPDESGTPVAHENRRAPNGNALHAPHIPVENMMCAFGVPGYMIHGTPSAGFSVIPVDFSVAPGMYTT